MTNKSIVGKKQQHRIVFEIDKGFYDEKLTKWAIESDRSISAMTRMLIKIGAEKYEGKTK